MTRRGFALALSVCSTVVLGPTPSAAGLQEPGSVVTFSSRVDTVRVDVLVTDQGAPVAGLQPSDFEVLDNGVPQRIDFFLHEELPLNVVLALDTSGSVTGERLAQLRTAALAVVDGLRADDKLALLTFGSTITIGTALTTDADRVRAALATQTDTGDTALVDATYAAVAVGESDLGRALVIVFSDGLDTASFLTSRGVLETARRSDAVVYAVTVGNAPPDGFLDDITRATGGRTLGLRSTENLDQTFVGILDEFRQRYLLSYTPTNVDGGWHDLVVRVKNRRVDIRARPGYFAGRR